MINLTRLNGQAFVLNCDLIERVDATPDTVLTLVDGTKYVVTESLDEVVERVRSFRSAVIAAADVIATAPPLAPVLHVVPDSEER
jgi:flagellar protein FlbD